MNTEIQPFEFEGNKVRALADGDEVVFVASDIARFSDTATPRTSPAISMTTRGVYTK